MDRRIHSGGSPRDGAVDAVKSIAICGVLVTHTSAAAFGMGAVGSPAWLWALFWGSLSHACVPLFLMASGALLLDPGHPMSLRKLCTKNMPRLLAALLFWAVCYKIFSLTVLSGAGLSWEALFHAGKEVLLFRHEEHLYYLHIMLLVYAFLPVTRLVAARGERGLLRYLLGLWFLLGILYPTVKSFWPFTLLTGIPAQWRMNMTYAAIGYTLLGRYLAQHHRGGRRLPWVLASAVGAGWGFFGTWALSGGSGTLDLRFLEGMGVPMCLLAAGIFGACLARPVPPAVGRLTAYLSRASFCVFLTHIFFLKGFARLGLTVQAGPAAVTVPVLALVLLACGCGVYEALRRIPVVNRYLI